MDGEKNQRARNSCKRERKKTKYGRLGKVEEQELERLPSQSWPRFSLVFPCYPGDIYLLFFAKATPLFRSPPFFTVWPPTPRSSPPRPVSFRSGPAKAGQYVILAVSLFLRTKAGSKLEKPRHAHNGRNPAAFPPPFERNLGCVQATTTILSRNSRFFIFSRFSHLFRIKI